jgi:hypothetical protein
MIKSEEQVNWRSPVHVPADEVYKRIRDEEPESNIQMVDCLLTDEDLDHLADTNHEVTKYLGFAVLQRTILAEDKAKKRKYEEEGGDEVEYDEVYGFVIERDMAPPSKSKAARAGGMVVGFATMPLQKNIDRWKVA